MKRTRSEKVFSIVNMGFLLLVTFVALMPIINILAISLSSKSAVMGGKVTFLPADFTFESYKIFYEKPDFIRSFLVTLKRLALGVPLAFILTIITAYPLSKEETALPGRTAFAYFLMFTTIFSGGLMPTYFMIKQYGLLDSLWSLVLPCALQVFNIILLLNFFRTVPKEMEEAALIDGAGQCRVLWNVYLPVAKPGLATVLLFIIVGHWNSWFDGIIYMTRPINYPLQSYLRSILITDSFLATITDPELLRAYMQISERTTSSAQVFIAMLPMLILYPFLQKYFVKGIVIGSVKG